MFGYIRSARPALSAEDSALYESFYCGLCQTTGRHFGKWSRFLLSYDTAFLSLFHATVSPQTKEEIMPPEKRRCPFNPLSKKECSPYGDSLHFGASMGMLLFYYKVKDNIADQRGIKKTVSRLTLPLAGRQRKKVLLLYPDTDQLIGAQMEEQSLLESENCVSIDRAAAPSAEGLGHIFSLIDPSQSEELRRFGFLLGRWIYLIDAADDFEKDLKEPSYNVFALQNPTIRTREELAPLVTPILNRTLYALAESYQKIRFSFGQDLLNNIIYLSLPIVQRAVLAGNYHKIISRKESISPIKETES